MRNRLANRGGMTRRHFLSHLATTSLAIPALSWLENMRAHADQIRKQGKSVILLWMSGGPATIDMWDMKPGAETGGEFKPISTSVPDIHISEYLPETAKIMHHLAIIRSMSTVEADHSRGTYKMHTGYRPSNSMQHPSFGALVAHQLGPKVDIDLPHFISINTPSVGPCFLGMAYAPFVVNNPGSPIANIKPPSGVDSIRQRSRLAYLSFIERDFIRQKRGRAAQDHMDVYQKAVRLMTSDQLKAFDLSKEDERIKERYGDNSFGRGCLIARRLVEAGVSFVEVGLGGWDTHSNTFEAHRTRLQPTVDKALSALVTDLVSRGLYEKTLVVWMGEFGRTPRINQNVGRDHYARAWSVVLGGCGIAGGAVVGKTNADGTQVVDRPVDTPDLIATFCKALGIPTDLKFITPNGRPYWVVDRNAGAGPIEELFT